jgi:phosphomevalonate kinase
MTGKTDNHENIPSSAVIAALKRRGYKVVDYTINVYVFKSHDPEGYCVTLPGDGETLSAKMVRNILKHEPVNADEVVSEALEQMDNDKPLVIDVAEAMRVIKSTNFKKANRTPEQLKRIHATMQRIKEESAKVTDRINVSGNMDEYFE